MKKYVSIGFTKGAFGIRGELKVNVKDEYFDDFLEAKIIFLKLLGKEVPFFVEEIQEGKEVLLKLEEVDTRDDALPLCRQEMFLREEDLVFEEAGTGDDLSKFIGFSIADTRLGEIGAIEDILELPEQLLAVVNYREQEVLIPLHEDLIEKIDAETRRILMTLPEGLLEL